MAAQANCIWHGDDVPHSVCPLLPQRLPHQQSRRLLTQEAACPVSLSSLNVLWHECSPMSSGMAGQAARQRPCLGLGVFAPRPWSAQEAGIQHPLRAQAGASGPRHEPTGTHAYCNTGYKSGTLVLPCTVKCRMLFLSLQYSTKSLNHS